MELEAVVCGSLPRAAQSLVRSGKMRLAGREGISWVIEPLRVAVQLKHSYVIELTYV